jgi:FAD:protein FMN transferase
VQDSPAARSGEVAGPGEAGALSRPGGLGGPGALSRPGESGGLAADQQAGPAVVVSIRDGGLATAGASAVRWRHGGEVLPHILRPGGGSTLADSPWRLVSVTAASCAEARAASIAAIIRGSAAVGWLSGLGLPARLVDSAGRVRTLAGWPADNVSAGSAGGTAGAASAVSLAESGSGSGAEARRRAGAR